MGTVKDSWRFIDTGSNNPYMNMAIDEALIQEMTEKGMPIFRFFDWQEPSISIGYSQKASDVLRLELCEKEEIPIVRRPTGGGVVFHGVDITYSVVLSEAPGYSIHKSFIDIQSNIMNGLNTLGIKCVLYNKKERGPSEYCFTSPNIGDLCVDKRKLGGLAARRIKGKLLCQGYIYFEDASFMVKFTKGLSLLDKKAISIQDVLGKDINRNTAKEAIIRNWACNVRDVLNDKEEELAGKLYEQKYSQDEWNYRR